MMMRHLWMLWFAVALFAALAGGTLALRGSRLGRRRAYGMILLSALFFVSLFGGMRALVQARTQVNAAPYRAELSARVTSISLPYEETTVLFLDVANLGTELWDSSGARGVFLSFHVFTSDGTLVRFDNPRTAFLEVLRPGERRTVAVSITPLELNLPPGNYLLEFDLVKEGVTWFGHAASPTLRLAARVVP